MNIDYRITIDNYFKNDKNPKIYVNDIYNLLLINWNAGRSIVFKTNHGYTNKLFIKNTVDCNQMVEYFCKIIGYERIYRKDKLQFMYNGKQIRNDPYITIGQCFQNDSNPLIFVNDIYNLLLINWKQTKNITFMVNNNYKKKYTFDNSMTLNSILEDFLLNIDHYELKNKSEIKYLYNGLQISFDPDTVGEFFLNDYNPIIYVMDMNNLIKPIDITFKTIQGIFNISVYYKRTAGYLLMKYLDEIGHSELIDRNDKIKFLYKAKQIKFWDKTNVNTLFLNDNNPLIVVIDTDNVLSNNTISKINVIFDSFGKKSSLLVNFGTTIEQLIKKYLFKVGKIELIENYSLYKNHIYILYNGIRYFFNDQNYVEKIFFNNPIPKVLIYLN